MKVVKFGGSSLSDAAQFRKVKEILDADPERVYIVPSAPGKRSAGDEKVTDMLYACHALAQSGKPFDDVFDRIAQRYGDIIGGLGLDVDLSDQLARIKSDIASKLSPDYAASRGEYLCGLVMSAYLGWDFIDAAEVIKFDKSGACAWEWTNEVLGERLKNHARAVIPGFYGTLLGGEIKTFPRNGSDISGAIVARAAAADVYENWSDVPGFLMADPRIVDNPRLIERLTYRELRELSYMGATVLHEDSVFPVRKAGIPTNIRDTGNPDSPGTTIVKDGEECGAGDIITGIAGHKNFSLISIEKAMMNNETGFGRRVLQVLEEHGVSFEHLPTGIDTMSVIISDTAIDIHRDRILEQLREVCQPDSLEMVSGLALIATVGRGMVRTRGTAARLFTALAQAKVNVRMIDQGSSELNIIVGVDTCDFENAVRAIYKAFVNG